MTLQTVRAQLLFVVIHVAAQALRAFHVREVVLSQSERLGFHFIPIGLNIRRSEGDRRFGGHMALFAFQFVVSPFQRIAGGVVVKIKSLFKVRGGVALGAVVGFDILGKLAAMDVFMTVHAEF